MKQRPCPECGHLNPEGVAFCGACGALLRPSPIPAVSQPAPLAPDRVTCRRCKYPDNTASSRYCIRCGHPLHGGGKVWLIWLAASICLASMAGLVALPYVVGQLGLLSAEQAQGLMPLMSNWITETPTVTVTSSPTATPTPEPTPTATLAPEPSPTAGEPNTSVLSFDTLKIAILAPLSGDVAIFGQSTRNGVLLAVEEWNARGGANGKTIEVVVEDSQCSAEAAVSAANRVIDQDGVKFIIGEVCSHASIAVSEVVLAKGAFQISPTSTNPNVTVAKDGTTKDRVFRACFIDPFQGTVGAKFALESLHARTAAVFLDQGNDYVRGLAENFRGVFEAGGGRIVVWESYTSDTEDFSAMLNRVKDASPDILYLPDYYSTVNVIAAQAREKGITAVIMGGDGWDSEDLDLAAVDGGYFTNHYSPEDTHPQVQEFVENYQAKYGTVPDALAALAYDAAYILFQSMTSVKSTDPAKVAEAMESGSFPVVSGTITYDAQHNPAKSAVIMQVRDGEVIYIDALAP